MTDNVIKGNFPWHLSERDKELFEQTGEFNQALIEQWKQEIENEYKINYNMKNVPDTLVSFMLARELRDDFYIVKGDKNVH